MSDQFDKPLFIEVALQAKIDALEIELGMAHLALRDVVVGLEAANKLADEGWAYVIPWVQRQWEFKERLDKLDLLLKDNRKWLG